MDLYVFHYVHWGPLIVILQLSSNGQVLNVYPNKIDQIKQ